MFLFNFYSNTDLYITIYMGGLVFTAILFALSIMFDSKRILFLFVSSTILCLMINVGTFPMEIILTLFVFVLVVSIKFKGPIKHKIFVNILSFIIGLVLVLSGTFSITHFIKEGDNKDQTFMNKEIKLEKF